MAKPLKKHRPLTAVATPSVRLARFIAKFLPDTQALAKAVLRKMRAHFPGATEMVYDNYNALVIGFCPNDRASDVICSIGVYPRWINLYFFEGDTLPDPDGLLLGAGSMVRRVVLQHADDLDRPAVRALIRAAINAADPPLNPDARRKLVIKAVSDKQRPRRPAHKQGGDFSPRRLVRRVKRSEVIVTEE